MATQFGNRIKELRSQQNLLQRQVPALLEMDTPLYRKTERGEGFARKELVIKPAGLLRSDKNKFLTLCLADQVYDIIKNEDKADEVLKSVSVKI